MTDFFNIIFVYPIINVLVAIYQLLNTIGIPYALGFSIILLTIVIRLLLYPLTSSQLKASKKMQDIAPHLSKLKEKHKGDAKRQQQEMMRLYKEHGVNPAAGCLPTILQFPILIALYNVFNKIVNLNGNSIVNEMNKIIYFDFTKLNSPWDQSFFGIPLGKSPSNLLTTIGVLIFLVPILTAVLQFIQTKMMMAKKDGSQVKKGKQNGSDFATAFQTQSLYIFPVMIGFFSYSLPMGLSLYWNTLTLFGILQQYRISGLGGLEEWINKFKNRANLDIKQITKNK